MFYKYILLRLFFSFFQSKSEKINQLEKRIFRFAKQRKAAESNLECENVTALSHSNLHEKLMNKKVRH